MSNLKWSQPHGEGVHYMTEFNGKDDIVMAKVFEMRVSTSAQMQMRLPEKYNGEPPRKTFGWGGPMTYLSSSYRNWKRERALKKAKKWCEKVWQEYIDIISMG